MRNKNIEQKMNEQANQRLLALENNLNISPEIRQQFNDGIVNLFVDGRIVYEHNLSKKVAQLKSTIEQKYNIIVYAIIYDNTNLGELYSMLCVSSYEEDWEFEQDSVEYLIPYAYVVNDTYKECSEFGSISVAEHNNGLIRVY